MRACNVCSRGGSAKNKKIALALLSFTAGMIVASFLPYGAVMFLLCVALILLGITLLRR
ncbi:MAG: hypothetical protein ACI4IV_01730 [Acutalibacteraceae bacterium]